MSRHTQSDLPLLRNVEQVLDGMIQHANNIKRHSDSVGELLAVASVLDQLQADADRVKRSIRKLKS